ncbi:MAG: hypothetical protein U1E88_08765 [Acinetobacter sp.]
MGKSPWPNTFKREHYTADLQEQFKDDKAQLKVLKAYVKVAGRVMLNRGFIHCDSDMTGRIQGQAIKRFAS